MVIKLVELKSLKILLIPVATTYINHYLIKIMVLSPEQYLYSIILEILVLYNLHLLITVLLLKVLHYIYFNKIYLIQKASK